MNRKTTREKKAVVLLSGGLDSTTVLAIARAAGYACYCLSFRYGQRQVLDGISLEEQKRLTGVAVDAVIDSVSVKTTFKETLAELGIEK